MPALPRCCKPESFNIIHASASDAQFFNMNLCSTFCLARAGHYALFPPAAIAPSTELPKETTTGALLGKNQTPAKQDAGHMLARFHWLRQIYILT